MKTIWISYSRLFLFMLILACSNAFAGLPDGDTLEKKSADEPVSKVHGFSLRLPLPDPGSSFSYLRFEVRLFMERDQEITELPEDGNLESLRFNIESYMPEGGEDILELPEKE